MVEGVRGPEPQRAADPGAGPEVAVPVPPCANGPNGRPPWTETPEDYEATPTSHPKGADDLARPISWRKRISTAADKRRVPLDAILATVGVVVATGLILLLLWVLREEVLYVIVATFVALLLTPAVKRLERRRVSHGLAVTLVFLAGVLAFCGLVYLFGSPLVSAVDRFAHQLPTLVNQAEHGKGQIGKLIKRFHLQHWISQNAPKLSTLASKISGPALHVGTGAFSILLALGTMAVLSFFILLEGEGVARGLIGMMRPDRAARIHRVAAEVERSISGYMLGNIATSIIAGIVVGITLLILGVPFALLLALWVGLVDLLPLVGGLLAAVPVVIVALLHSFPAFLVTLIVFLVYQQVENHVLNPLIMSRTVRLNPLWVLLAVLVGAKLGGTVGGALGTFVGALIGIPLGGAIQVVVREVRRSEPLPEEGPSLLDDPDAEPERTVP